MLHLCYNSDTQSQAPVKINKIYIADFISFFKDGTTPALVLSVLHIAASKNLKTILENKMKARNTLLATVIAIVLGSSLSFAANDGNLGSTSQGDLELNLSVLDSVEISSLNDIDFGSYGAGNTGGINQGDAFCVYVNGADDYTITPTSSNGSFALAGNNQADTIPYVVKLVGAATGAAAATATNYNAASATFQGANTRDCGSANNACLDISIAESDIRAATTDTYADTLILLVNPV